ncbi:MAG: 16S rRNA processing protein RimM [Chlorobiaceae bacterium]|nr:16S rRNA processing protein RimM [Chlorobiaceae bacterium]
MELYVTGVILKPKGLQGEVKVELVTDFPESFLSRKEYYAGKSIDSVERLKVKKAALSAGFAWLFFEGIDSVEKAEALTGWKLFVTEDQLLPQPDNRAYVHEIIGMKLLDRDRREAGIVTNVIRMPAHEVYEVQVGEKKILVPAIEEFVEEFNLSEKYMVIPRYGEFL